MPAFLIAYLLGSIPFGLLLTKAAGIGDIRKIGSGNIGATNVLRTGNKTLALLTLLLDGGKGYLAVKLAYPVTLFFSHNPIGQDPALEYSIYDMLTGVVLGHMFPIWLRFKGGKGVATAFGGMLAIFPLYTIIGLGIWLLVFLVMRISSLAALISINFIPLIILIFWECYMCNYMIQPALPLFVVALLVTCRHASNIRRLLNGTEPKFGNKK